ncbi:hypothetical protein D3C85_973380 [compost metagenome]
MPVIADPLVHIAPELVAQLRLTIGTEHVYPQPGGSNCVHLFYQQAPPVRHPLRGA